VTYGEEMEILDRRTPVILVVIVATLSLFAAFASSSASASDYYSGYIRETVRYDEPNLQDSRYFYAHFDGSELGPAEGNEHAWWQAESASCPGGLTTSWFDISGVGSVSLYVSQSGYDYTLGTGFITEQGQQSWTSPCGPGTYAIETQANIGNAPSGTATGTSSDPGLTTLSSNGPKITSLSDGGVVTDEWNLTRATDSNHDGIPDPPVAPQPGPGPGTGPPQPPPLGPKALEMASTCGKARFNWYKRDAVSRYFIDKGNQACSIVVSNRLAKLLLKTAFNTPNKSVSQIFGDLLQLSVQERQIDDPTLQQVIAQKIWDKVNPLYDWQKTLITKVLREWAGIGVLARASEPAGTLNPIFLLGKAIGMAALPLTIAYDVTNIWNHGACMQFNLVIKKKLVDQGNGNATWISKATMDSDVLPNPKFISQHNIAYALRKKVLSHFRPDTVEEKQLNLSCNRLGTVTVGHPRDTNEIFSQARTVKAKAPF